MALKLDELFPRTREWLNRFYKNVLRYSPDEEEILLQMITYLKEVKIPGLPKELEKIDAEIAAAWPNSVAQRQLKSRKARWPKYCENIRMNLQMLEQFLKG